MRDDPWKLLAELMDAVESTIQPGTRGRTVNYTLAKTRKAVDRYKEERARLILG